MPINYKLYPKNWKELVAVVNTRAGNKCEFCGIPNRAIKENGTKVVLTTAHLDHDAENHDVQIDRLAALCQKCHLEYDRPMRIAKMKAKKELLKQVIKQINFK